MATSDPYNPGDDPTLTSLPGAAATAAAPARERDPYCGLLLKNRYRIEKLIGRGGVGVVYLARDQEILSRAVVVKILQQDSSADPYLRKKFRQEMEALARLDHPGVVGVLDVGSTPAGLDFLVLQYIDGVTLRTPMKSGAFELTRLGNIALQIGQALGAAHDRGICHRDLKPENIMLQTISGQEIVKLIDFGIAAVKDSLFAGTGSTRIAGTFAYMAPEQFEGKWSPLSDIYTFGVIAFELATGRRPFEAESPFQFIYAQKAGLRRKPADLRPELTAAAEAGILRAIEVDPLRRWESAREFGVHMAATLVPAAGPAPAAPADSSERLEIAHVLFLDFERFTLLPSDRQRRYLVELQDLVRKSPRFQAAESAGELIRLPTGDGMALVFFGDPVAPAQCALELHAVSRSFPHLLVRMGVHSGPVYRMADINTNLNVAGGGINKAQRVMDCASAGQILVSQTVAEVLSQLSQWAPRLTYVGERQDKHGIPLQIYNLATGEPAAAPSVPPAAARPMLAPEPAPGAAPIPAGQPSSATTLSIRLHPKDGLRYIWVPAGTFQMGCSPGDRESDEDEHPAHTVTISKGFWLCETPITVGAYKRFADATGRDMPPEPNILGRSLNPAWANDQVPMVNATWPEAKAYSIWMGGRLPTEAEWEYAARAGSSRSRYGAIDEVGWLTDNSGDSKLDSTRTWSDRTRGISRNFSQRLRDNGNRMHEVRQKLPNGFGFYDMLGNVWEWAADHYDESFYERSPTFDPLGPSETNLVVVRGGSWASLPRHLRASCRGRNDAQNGYVLVGFRCIWNA